MDFPVSDIAACCQRGLAAIRALIAVSHPGVLPARQVFAPPRGPAVPPPRPEDPVGSTSRVSRPQRGIRAIFGTPRCRRGDVAAPKVILFTCEGSVRAPQRGSLFAECLGTRPRWVLTPLDPIYMEGESAHHQKWARAGHE